MALLDFFRRTNLTDRQEAAVMKTLQSLRSQRRNRFRILACIDGSEEAMITVRFAAQLAATSSSSMSDPSTWACIRADCRCAWRGRT